MRTSLSVAAVFAFVGTSIVGCGGSDADSDTTIDGAGTATSQSSPSNDPIVSVTQEFLEAVRNGDTDVARSKLTPLALQRTSELNMQIAPPGSPSASFEIGAVDQVEKDKAIVESIWTDLDPEGQQREEQIVWALRLVEAGWRISGMAAEVDPDQPAVIIDFENPGALFQQQPVASEANGANPAVQTARDPFQQAPPR